MSYKFLGKDGIMSRFELEEKLGQLGLDGVAGIIRDINTKGAASVRGHRILLLK